MAIDLRTKRKLKRLREQLSMAQVSAAARHNCVNRQQEELRELRATREQRALAHERELWHLRQEKAVQESFRALAEIARLNAKLNHGESMKGYAGRTVNDAASDSRRE